MCTNMYEHIYIYILATNPLSDFYKSQDIHVYSYTFPFRSMHTHTCTTALAIYTCVALLTHTAKCTFLYICPYIHHQTAN